MSRNPNAIVERKGPSRLARVLATTALNHCVSYHGRKEAARLAEKMQYVLDTGKSLRRTQ